MLTNGERHGTALFRVTGEALSAIVVRRVLLGRLNVRIVTTDASQSTSAVSVAFAQDHREIVLKQVRLRRRVALQGHHEYGQSMVQRRSWAEVLKNLPRFQYAGVPRLMT